MPRAAVSGAEVTLPAVLLPERPGSSAGLTLGPRQNWSSLERPLVPRIGTSTRVVQTCRDSIVAAALPYGAVRVDAASAGPTARGQDGGFAAPIEVRVVYARSGASQVRQSRVTCQIGTEGQVVGLR